MNNTDINIHDLVKLKLTAFRALSDEILTKAQPLLEAEGKRLDQIAYQIRDEKPYIGQRDKLSQAWDLAYLFRDRADVAKRWPKKRKESADKKARKDAREGRARAATEKENLYAPSVNLIRGALKSAEDQIAVRILDRYQASFTDLVKRYERVLAEGHTVKSTGAKVEATRNTFWDACSVIVRGSPAWNVFFAPVDRSVSFNDPLREYPHRTLAEATKLLKPIALREADHFVGSYAYKICERTIARHYASTKHNKCDIVKVKSNGIVWTGAEIDVTVTSGTDQEYVYRFTTKCIINFSKFAKPFNQWPTREIKSAWESEDQATYWKA